MKESETSLLGFPLDLTADILRTKNILCNTQKMIANKKFKGFGPSQAASLSHFSAPVYQRGEGLGSFFSNIFSKIHSFTESG